MILWDHQTGEFNCSLNYPKCTYGKLLPRACAHLELIRANTSDTRFSGFIQKKSTTKHHILPMIINTKKWNTNQIIFICAVGGIKYQNTSKAIIIYHWSSISLEKISHKIFFIYLNCVKDKVVQKALGITN